MLSRRVSALGVLIGCGLMFGSGYIVGSRRPDVRSPRELLVNVGAVDGDDPSEEMGINPRLEKGWTIKSVYRYNLGENRFALYDLVVPPGEPGIWDILHSPVLYNLPRPSTTPSPSQ